MVYLQQTIKNDIMKEPQIGGFEERFGVKVDMKWIMDEVSKIVDKYIFLTPPPAPKEPERMDKVELVIDRELRDDSGGLAGYVAAEIEQSDIELRERCVKLSIMLFLDSSDTTRARILGVANDIFNYIKTGKHE